MQNVTLLTQSKLSIQTIEPFTYTERRESAGGCHQYTGFCLSMYRNEPEATKKSILAETSSTESLPQERGE